MKLYLMRHGKAKHPYEDPRRALNPEGIDGVNKVAAILEQNHEKPDVIRHSSKIRAVETAHILAVRLGCADIVEVEGLCPEDPVEPVWQELAGQQRLHNSQSLMLVGHLPFMGLLCSALLNGDAAGAAVHFSEATIICMERPAKGGWSLLWTVSPELADLAYV